VKFFAVKMNQNKIEKKEIEQDLGIEFEHKGSVFTISENNIGELVLRAINEVQILVYPMSSNCIELRAE
jgi:predicted Mrr-cat superfamily restriction endonuclease